jgi:hypothetical protein
LGDRLLRETGALLDSRSNDVAGHRKGIDENQDSSFGRDVLQEAIVADAAGFARQRAAHRIRQSKRHRCSSAVEFRQDLRLSLGRDPDKGGGRGPQ